MAFLRKLQKRRNRQFNLIEFIGECTTSAFAGVLAFWVCQWAEQVLGLHPSLTPAIVGVAGHMGSRFIVLLEGKLTKKVESAEE